MENTLATRLQSVQSAEAQTYKNIAIVPLIVPEHGRFQYRTLGEALATHDVAITEVSNAGSVPELLVFNRSKASVLLLDGEELAGAKQNRVLNTSILLKELSETKIPVSCTEQGRWAYASTVFKESGNVMAYKSRSRKARSVHRSLETSGDHQSDQGEVWDGIAELQDKAGASSPTSAMSDVYKARDEDLRKCDEVFSPVPNQVGLLAFIDGQPAGADMVSLSHAYTRLHSKLVRSYTLEGLLEAPKSGATQPADWAARARHFLDEIADTEQRQFPAVGYGIDFRYRSRPKLVTIHPGHSTISGTALVHEGEVIHTAFFRMEDYEEPQRMASYRSRRRHFTE